VDLNDLVARAEALPPMRIKTICRVLNVSERQLRKAFHKIHGMPPHRHLHRLRLQQARQALMARKVTVTEIATQFGFFQFGRFAGEYRKAFGECPSQTIKR